MPYKHDMSQENESGKVLLPEGWRDFEIVNCVETVSKQGNDMFKFTFVDKETTEDVEVYAISTPKKRWFLKQILSACKVMASEDGIYEWDIPDVLGKTVSGLVVHEPNDWTDKYGKLHKDKQSKITQIGLTGDKKPDIAEELPF